MPISQHSFYLFLMLLSTKQHHPLCLFNNIHSISSSCYHKQNNTIFCAYFTIFILLSTKQHHSLCLFHNLHSISSCLLANAGPQVCSRFTPDYITPGQVAAPMAPETIYLPTYIRCSCPWERFPRFYHTCSLSRLPWIFPGAPLKWVFQKYPG